MGEYDRQIATAKRIIDQKGRECTWRNDVPGAPVDPEKPWLPGPSTTEEHTVKIVFLPDTKNNKEFLQAMSKEPINVGDDYGLLAAVDFHPNLKSSVWNDDNDVMLRGIKSIEPLAPNGDIILYTIKFTVA